MECNEASEAKRRCKWCPTQGSMRREPFLIGVVKCMVRMIDYDEKVALHRFQSVPVWLSLVSK